MSLVSPVLYEGATLEIRWIRPGALPTSRTLRPTTDSRPPRRSGTPLTVLRLSQVYGPGDTSAKVLPCFVRACLRGDAPELRGDGSDTRDWLFVDDAIEAFLLALARRVPGTFNVATGAGSTVGEALAIVRRLTGFAGEPRRLPSATPPTHVVLDVARAREKLGYAPQVGLEEGLRRTVAWFRHAEPAPA